MSALLLTPKTTVEEVFRHLPQASRVFINYQTDCIGCPLARFCTLDEVAGVYEINLQTFLNELRQNAPSAIKNSKE